MSTASDRRPPYGAILFLLTVIAIAATVSASIAFADWNQRRIDATPEGRAAEAMRRALGK